MTWTNKVRQRWANLPAGVRLPLVIILFLCVCGLVAKPLYEVMKSWKTRSNLVDASTALEEDRMGAARDLSMAVLLSGDTNVEAFRILEKSMAGLRDPRHVNIARALMTHPSGTKTDRLAGFRALTLDAAHGIVNRAWHALPVQDRINPDFAVPFANRLFYADHLQDAATIIEGVPSKDWNTETQQLKASLFIRSGSDIGYDEAQRIIANNWEEDAADYSSWMDVLEEIPANNLDRALLESVIDELGAADTEAHPRKALMLARISYSEILSEKEKIISDAISKWREKAPVELARFLTHLGRDRDLQNLFSPDLIASESKLVELVLDSLIRTSKWAEASEFIDLYESQIPKQRRLFMSGLIGARTGEDGVFAQSWGAAIKDAKADSESDSLLNLYKLAKDYGLEPQAEEALIEAILDGRGPLPLYSDIQPLVQSLNEKSRDDLLVRVYAIFLSFEPSNPILLTQYGYLACLMDLVEPETVIKMGVTLSETYPEAAQIKWMLATVRVSGGQPEEAAIILDDLNTDPESLSPSLLALSIVTDVLTGNIPRDDKKVADIEWSKLLPCERRKFKLWLRGTAK